METGGDVGAGQRRPATRPPCSDGARTRTERGHARLPVDHKPLSPWRDARERWRKSMRGSTRHLVVDTPELLLSVTVLEAALGDRGGGKGWLRPLSGPGPRLQGIVAENGDAGSPGVHWVNEHPGVRREMVNHPWTGLRGVWTPRDAVRDGDTLLPTGLHLRPHRWVVERTHAWITHGRRLSCDGEGTHASSESLLSLAMSTRMVSSVARARPSSMSLQTHSQRRCVRPICGPGLPRGIPAVLSCFMRPMFLCNFLRKSVESRGDGYPTRHPWNPSTVPAVASMLRFCEYMRAGQHAERSA